MATFRWLRNLAGTLLLTALVAGCGAASPTTAATTVTVTVAASAPAQGQAAATPNGAQQLATALQVAASLASAAQAPTPTAVPLVSRPLDLTVPRQVQYADLQFKVTKAAITNQNALGQTVGNQAFAYVNLTVVNPLTAGNALGANLIKLSLADGQLYDEQSGATLSLGADTSGTMQLTYNVPPTATWDKASLVLARPQKEPATLPLTGTAPAATFPLKLAATGSAQAAPLKYTVKSAVLDLDFNGQRADQGQRFLTISLLVEYPAGNSSTGSYGLDDSSFRLVVDGLPMAPIKAPSTLVSPASATQGDVTFKLPASAKSVSLQVGDATSGKTALIPLSLSTSAT